jgi:DNA polymerase-3 subunit delta
MQLGLIPLLVASAVLPDLDNFGKSRPSLDPLALIGVHMTIYLYWGEDDFALTQAVRQLRESVLDPSWVSFNYDKIFPDQPDAVIQALNQAMTPPFGMGGRLVWVGRDNAVPALFRKFAGRTRAYFTVDFLRVYLLLTSPSRPDGRLKSTKLLQSMLIFGSIVSFHPEDGTIVQRVQSCSQEVARQI